MAESLGDLIQEHIHRPFGAALMAMVPMHSCLRQFLAQQLRTQLGIPPPFGASRNRARDRGAVIGRADAEELASVPVARDVFTWVVDNARLFGLPIPPIVDATARVDGVFEVA
jgi:hypothetical protein